MKSILGNFYRHLAIFYRSHCSPLHFGHHKLYSPLFLFSFFRFQPSLLSSSSSSFMWRRRQRSASIDKKLFKAKSELGKNLLILHFGSIESERVKRSQEFEYIYIQTCWKNSVTTVAATTFNQKYSAGLLKYGQTYKRNLQRKMCGVFKSQTSEEFHESTFKVQISYLEGTKFILLGSATV